MADKKFSQEELNRIVASRLNRERDRLTKEYESSLKRCMAAVHLTLYQEMCALKKDIAAETNGTLLSGFQEKPLAQPENIPPTGTCRNLHDGLKGGEQ